MVYHCFEKSDGRDDGCYCLSVKVWHLMVSRCSLASTGMNFRVISTIHYLNTCFPSPSKQSVRAGWRGHEPKDLEFELWVVTCCFRGWAESSAKSHQVSQLCSLVNDRFCTLASYHRMPSSISWANNYGQSGMSGLKSRVNNFAMWGDILLDWLITVPPSGWVWKGDLDVIWSNYPTQAEWLRWGCPGSCRGGFLVSPRMESPQPLWATCCKSQSHSQSFC